MTPGNNNSWPPCVPKPNAAHKGGGKSPSPFSRQVMAAETMETEAHRKIAPVAIDFARAMSAAQLERWRNMVAGLAAETAVMAATPTESTQLDTNRVLTAHKCIFTE